MERYVLRHKNKDVASFEINEDGDFTSLAVINGKEMPILGLSKHKNLPQWIRDRAIPDTRPELEKILKEAGCKTPEDYMFQNLALSLSDSYWICPDSQRDLKWRDVNLYDHPTGVISFKNGIYGTPHRISSNASLGGSLEKWNEYHTDGWHLLKKASGKIPFGLQNINESFASRLHKAQGFLEYTPYTLHFDKHGFCETCDCHYFTDAERELISAYNVTGGLSSDHTDSKDAYMEFVDICVKQGLDKKYVHDFLDYMLMTDFLITNTDRHWENFGILRDPDTLGFLSMAPIYDSGTSMMCNESYINDRINLLRIEYNGVLKSQEDNLSLVQDKNSINTLRLPTEKETKEYYTRCGVPDGKAKQIAECFELKRDMVMELQHGYWIGLENEYRYDGEPPYKDGTFNLNYRAENTTLTVLCGIQDMGKDLPAEKYRDENTVCVRINSIRKEIEVHPWENNNRVFQATCQRIYQALQNGKNVVFVATNLDQNARKNVLEAINDIPSVRKKLVVIYKDPQEEKNDIDPGKRERIAENLHDNQPSESEGWDEITFFEKDPITGKLLQTQDDVPDYRPSYHKKLTR